ncbi:MAG: hypothetical protein U9Q66_00275 [Patescibacteria group bacterium]|nr:hypothetical protein [Patescibacteria group bacterium]
MKTLSGVSSIIRATSVAFSKATIFLHSLPISFHLRSSFGKGISVVVTSLVTSHAYCCIDLINISLATSFLFSSVVILCF